MRALLRTIEVLCFALAVGCGGLLLTNKLEAAGARRIAAAVQPRAARVAARPGTLPPDGIVPDEAPASPSDHGVLGRLEIPALHLSTPILEDANADSLRRGAGHIDGTALPGGLGNFAVAAHRDTFFRPLSEVRPGMTVRVITPEGSFVYAIDSTRIVRPEDLSVLDTGNVPQMTLITCYPFHYIGAAPLRFAVSAHLVSF